MLHSLDREARAQRRRPRDAAPAHARHPDQPRAHGETSFRRHPEIADEEIGAPARDLRPAAHRHDDAAPRRSPTTRASMRCSGTSVRFPAPLPGWRPRRARCAHPDRRAGGRGDARAAMPELAAIHPFDALGPRRGDHAARAVVLQPHARVRTRTPVVLAPGSTRRTSAPRYVYLHRLLQFLQWQHRQHGPRAAALGAQVAAPPRLHAAALPGLPGRARRSRRTAIRCSRFPSICSMCFWLWKLGSDRSIRT